MMVADPVVAFAATLAEKCAYEAAAWAEGKALQAAADARLQAAYKRAYPRKRKWDEALAVQVPEIVQQRAEWEAFALPWRTAWQARREAFDATLRAFAAEAVIPITPELFPHDRVPSGRYRTQGWGALRYARDDAQRTVDKAVAHGLVAEVRAGTYTSRTDSYGHAYDDQEFTVWANTDEAGWTLLSYKPELPLREIVRRCWARGTNPRVTMWWLPSGYEESVALEYFGGETGAA